jgi:hypothetical protein
LKTMQTQELIEALESNCTPVCPLAHPLTRALAWSALSLLYIGATVWAIGPHSNLGARFGDWKFAIESGAALLTGVMAAGAAFCAGCPGRPIWERFAPVPFVAIWLGGLSAGCWSDWVDYGPAGLTIHLDFGRAVAILAVGSIPFLLMFAMVRRGAPVAPKSTMGLAALAAASLAAFAIGLLQRPDSNIMALAWQFGTVVALAALAAILGRLFLRWRTRDEELARLRRTDN